MELDEVFTWVSQKKNEVYIMTLVDRKASCIPGWAVEHEGTEHAFQTF